MFWEKCYCTKKKPFFMLYATRMQHENHTFFIFSKCWLIFFVCRTDFSIFQISKQFVKVIVTFYRRIFRNPFRFQHGLNCFFIRPVSYTHLGEFVREIVGLDMNAAKEAFSEYLTGTNLDSRQIYFVNQIVEYIVRNGMMKDFSCLLYTSPRHSSGSADYPGRAFPDPNPQNTSILQQTP